jgi:hypothetical protein
MDSITLFYVLIGLIVGFLFSIVVILKRILNILRKMNYGEPTQEELNNIEFSKFRIKK